MDDILTPISIKFSQQKLRDGLKKVSESDDVFIKSVKSRDYTGKKGDSYLSTLYRFTVTASVITQDNQENICCHVIAKGIPKNVARQKTFRSLDFFGTEIYFYQKIWPLMKKLKHIKNIREPDEVPLVLSSLSNGENDYIALKDLSFDGYCSTQRDLGLNQEQASLFLKSLANFHALSIAANHLIPEFESIARSLKETYFDETFRSWYSPFLQHKLYRVVRKSVKSQLDPVYLKKIDQLFSSDFYGRLCQLAKGSHSKLKGIAQGDAWMPNFLVKLESGKPVHVLLIDFQLARYSSVTGDLVHFLYSCITPEVLLNHWEDLVKEYYRYLSNRLSELDCGQNLVTMEDVWEDIQKNFHIGFAMAMESTVMALLEENEVPDLDTIQGEDAVPLEEVWNIYPFIDGPRNKRVAFLIKHAVDKGLI